MITLFSNSTRSFLCIVFIRNLPHILNEKSRNNGNVRYSKVSEQCWRSLLLKQENSHESANEWEIVREHFENSRSKKVLSILQQ
jgi:hypothetical protein